MRDNSLSRVRERDHELLNVTAGLAAVAHLLAEPEVSDKDDLVRALSAELERMRALLIEGFEPRVIGRYDAVPILRDVLLVYSFGAQIDCDIPASLPVFGDPGTLRHAMVNLLMNCAAHAAASPLTITAERAGGLVTIRVADAGPRGRSVGSPSGRQGVGLALSRRLLAEEGANVALVPRRGHGGHTAEVVLTSAGPAR